MAVRLDHEKCSGCGLCAQICHEHCLEAADHTVILHAETCSTCMQCIAVCPTRALFWDGVPPLAYNRERLPSLEQLDELFKERRTVRFLKKARLERSLLEGIVGYGIYAPIDNYNLRAVLVDNEQFIAEFDRINLRFARMLYKLLYKHKPVLRLLSTMAPLVGKNAIEHLFKAKPKVENDLKRGYTFNYAPAIIFIVGVPRITPLSEVSAQYMLYNMILYAHVKGIGSRLYGIPAKQV